MKHLKYLAAGILLTGSLLFIYYGKFIVNADHLNFSPWGDGYKNFYTLSYYLKNDSGTHFSGMNYPYGENVIYTDNQPLLAWTLKLVAKIFPLLNGHIHGILIWLVTLAAVLCFCTLYFLLIELKLPQWYSALGAVGITMLSPQLIRMNGHFSLAYSFYFPLIILGLIRFIHSGYIWRYPIYLTFLITAFSFIHPYYLAIPAFFLATSAVLFIITSKENKSQKLLLLLKTLTPVIIGFAVFKCYLLFTDLVQDRPQAPWGFVESRSTIADIFLHKNSWLYSLLHQLLPQAKIVFHFEGTAFIGFVAEIVLVVVVVTALINFLSKKSSIRFSYGAKIALLSSIPVLLFGMAFPFCINWFEKWLEYVPSFIKQFRAAGRFSWMFYYCASVFSVVAFYQFVLLVKNKKLTGALMFLFFFLWFIDVNMVNNFNRKEIQKWAVRDDGKEVWLQIESQLKKSGYNTTDFQAILPLPYFMNGCEKIYMESYANYDAMKISNASRLPIAATMMSRTSVSQSLSLVNLLSSNLIKKNNDCPFAYLNKKGNANRMR